MKFKIGLGTILLSIGGAAFADSRLFYQSSATQNLSHTVFDFIKTNALNGPLIIQDVAADPSAMKLANSAMKKCKLKIHESGFPLLVAKGKCTTGDYNIIDQLKANASTKNP